MLGIVARWRLALLIAGVAWLWPGHSAYGQFFYVPNGSFNNFQRYALGFNTISNAQNSVQMNSMRGGFAPRSYTYAPRMRYYPQYAAATRRRTIVPSRDSAPAARRGNQAEAISSRMQVEDPNIPLVWQRFGLSLVEADPSKVRAVDAKYSEGLQVAGVNPGSPAARSGWKRGDILIGLDRYQTKSLPDVGYIAQAPEVNTRESLAAIIIRDGQKLKTALDLKQ